MPAVTIGNHAKLTAKPSERPKVRRFFHEVLGCDVTRKSDEVDFFRFDGGFFLAVIYDDDTLEPAEHSKALWLELRVQDPAALTRKVRAFGVKELENWDKGRLYFQGPGGQVFRIAGTNEDLSAFEE